MEGNLVGSDEKNITGETMFCWLRDGERQRRRKSAMFRRNASVTGFMRGKPRSFPALVSRRWCR
jgi:hypothetical protein